MIIVMAFMLVVHVAIVQIVGVTFVLNCGMPATRAMNMVVLTVMMFVSITHWFSSWLSCVRQYYFTCTGALKIRPAAVGL